LVANWSYLFGYLLNGTQKIGQSHFFFFFKEKQDRKSDFRDFLNTLDAQETLNPKVEC